MALKRFKICEKYFRHTQANEFVESFTFFRKVLTRMFTCMYVGTLYVGLL